LSLVLSSDQYTALASFYSLSLHDALPIFIPSRPPISYIEITPFIPLRHSAFIHSPCWINIDYAIATVAIYLFCSKFYILISFVATFTKVAALIFFNTIRFLYSCVIMCFIVMPAKILIKHFQCLYFVITVCFKYLTVAFYFVYYLNHSINLSA